MSPSNEAALTKLQRHVFTHPTATLYKELWRHLPESFEETPLLTWEILARCPLEKRTYSTEKLAVHVAYREKEACLIARTGTDLLHEVYGDSSTTRPLVAFFHRHHAIEKSLWFYEHNILPLIAVDNLDTALHMAHMYDVDALVLDTLTARTILPHASTLPSLKSIRIIDHKCDTGMLEDHDGAPVTFVLATPEVGSIAISCPHSSSDATLFHPVTTTVLEHGDTLIVSRTIPFPTPIIRYDTGIKTKPREHTCSCKDATETFELYE